MLSCFGWTVLVLACLGALSWVICSIVESLTGEAAARGQTNRSTHTASRKRYLPKETDRRIVVRKDGKLRRFALNEYGEIFEES